LNGVTAGAGSRTRWPYGHHAVLEMVGHQLPVTSALQQLVRNSQG
jgi:hypothetical protein